MASFTTLKECFNKDVLMKIMEAQSDCLIKGQNIILFMLYDLNNAQKKNNEMQA